MQLHTIEPFYDSDSRILILGSFPSVKSRETGFYYGHPQNRFWTVLASVFSDSIPASIEDKKAFLKKHHIALFDVIRSCEIRGSSDTSIQSVVPNDIRSIVSGSDIRCIYCNGSTAYRLYDKYIRDTLCEIPINKNAVLLPSTSPANASYSLPSLKNAWSRLEIPLHQTTEPLRCYKLREYSLDFHGKKLYKLSLDGNFTCPNRDGTKGQGGCIFCKDGSGSFSGTRDRCFPSISEQLKYQKELISSKLPHKIPVSYIAYFQSYTGTYAPVSQLKKIYSEAVSDPEVDILSIATRPDCLGLDVLELLKQMNQIKPVWIELGLQTSNEKTARMINRCYKSSEYRSAVRKLNAIGISMIITHIILGLPGETEKDMLSTVQYALESGSTGIKFQLLHILEGTEIEKLYRQGKVPILSLDEYCNILKSCVSLLPSDVVVHRFTGDGDKSFLVAPPWSANKKAVINTIDRLNL